MEINEAKEKLLNSLSKIDFDEEEVALTDAIGRASAEDIESKVNVPSFPKSAMDGYAVCSEDIAGASEQKPIELKVISKLFAGETDKVDFEHFSAVRVMTGSIIPDGYDAVVMQEDSDYGEQCVLIKKEVKPYTNYCKVGEDIKNGETVINKGAVINRTNIGTLASIGISKVKVYSKPKVGIISTGTELCFLSDELNEGQIYSSISYMLKSQLESYGIDSEICICSDNQNDIKDRVLEYLDKNDVVITTGGVSVGEKDLIPDVLNEIDADTVFSRVNIKPGTPTMASVKDGKLILSLSGNPFAALANFDYYFWDVLAKVTGNNNYKSKIIKTTLANDYEKLEKTKRLLRAKLDNGKAYLEKVNSSSVISNMSECNCYVLIDENKTYNAGDEVEVLMMK